MKLIELLRAAGAGVAYHDPWVPQLDEDGVTLVRPARAGVRRVVIVTAHSRIDYAGLVDDAAHRRPAQRRSRAGVASDKVWKL